MNVRQAQLPTEWELKKLEEVCRFINGKAYSKTELLNKGRYPVLRVGNFFTNNQWYYSDLELDEDKYCDYGDLLYAWSASFGPRIWEGEKVIYHYHIWKVIPDNNYVTKQFLFQLLKWDTEALKIAHGTGTTMMHVGKGSIEKRLVPIPPLPEQRRIVAILDEAFAVIAKAKANAEQNLKNAKELFESYLQGVFENRNCKQFEFGEICELVGGSQPSKKEFIYEPKGGYIRFVQVRDYRSDRFKTYIPKSLAKRFCSSNDIMIGRYGPPIFGIFKGLEGAYNVALMKAVVNETICNRDYFYWFLQNNKVREFVEKSSKRAVGQDGVRRELLEKYLIPVPSLLDQKDIVHNLSALRAETQKLETIYKQKLASLEELKKSILNKAFSGELNTSKICV